MYDLFMTRFLPSDIEEKSSPDMRTMLINCAPPQDLCLTGNLGNSLVSFGQPRSKQSNLAGQERTEHVVELDTGAPAV